MRHYAALRARHSDQLVAHIDTLRAAYGRCRPARTSSGIRWLTIKSRFSRSVPRQEARCPSLIRKRESGIWQRRYWKHTIRDARDYAVHRDDIHFNPVKHGPAVHPSDWPFSSFAKCVKLGIHPAGWATEAADLIDVGERS